MGKALDEMTELYALDLFNSSMEEMPLKEYIETDPDLSDGEKQDLLIDLLFERRKEEEARLHAFKYNMQWFLGLPLQEPFLLEALDLEDSIRIGEPLESVAYKLDRLESTSLEVDRFMERVAEAAQSWQESMRDSWVRLGSLLEGEALEVWASMDRKMFRPMQ